MFMTSIISISTMLAIRRENLTLMSIVTNP